MRLLGAWRCRCASHEGPGGVPGHPLAAAALGEAEDQRGVQPPDPELDGHHSRAASPRRQTGPGPRQGKRYQTRRREPSEQREPRQAHPQSEASRGSGGGGGWKPAWRGRGESGQQPGRQDWADDRRWSQPDRAQSWRREARGPGAGRRPPQQAEALGTARGPAWGFGLGGGTRPEPGEAGGSRAAGSWAGARCRQICADLSL